MHRNPVTLNHMQVTEGMLKQKLCKSSSPFQMFYYLFVFQVRNKNITNVWLFIKVLHFCKIFNNGH